MLEVPSPVGRSFRPFGLSVDPKNWEAAEPAGRFFSARHLEVGNRENNGIFRRMIGRSKWDSIFFGQNEIEVDQNELKKIQVVSSRCLSCRLCIRRVMHYRFQNHQHLTLVTRHLGIFRHVSLHIHHFTLTRHHPETSLK